MRLLPLLLLLLPACDARGRDTGTDGVSETDADTDADADADGDTDTDTDPYVPDCADWTLTESQRFERETLFAETELAGLGAEQGPGAALADLDGDGDLDVFMAVNAGHSLVFRNDGGVLVVDPSYTADGGPLPVGNGVAAADLDADGAVDVVLSAPVGIPDRVLYNDGHGAFTSVALADSDGESMTPALADLDGDGRLDIVIAGFSVDYEQPELQPGVHAGMGTTLYLQGTGRSWTDARDRIPEEYQFDLTYMVTPLDLDLDGDLDLFFANDHGIATRVPNLVLVNDGTGHFTRTSGCGCETAMSGMGGAVGDPNGDGTADLYVSNWGNNQLLLSLGGGQYYDAAAAAGVATGDNGTSDSITFGARFTDLDRDGYEDLAVTYGLISPGISDIAPETQPDKLYRNRGDGTFEDLSASIGFDDPGYGRSVLSGDLDGDGTPDLVVSGRVFLLVYLGSGGCPGPTLTLDAGPGNPAGVGARVDVEGDGFAYHRYLLPAGTLGQSAAEVPIGLGGQADVRLRVTWPDGSTTETTATGTGPLHLVAD